MKIDLIEQWIQSQAKSAYDIKSRQAWVKAMRIAGLDEQAIMRVYEIRFEKQFVGVTDDEYD